MDELEAEVQSDVNEDNDDQASKNQPDGYLQQLAEAPRGTNSGALPSQSRRENCIE